MRKRKPTQREIDQVVEVHTLLKSYEQRYATLLSQIKQYGPGVYGAPDCGIELSTQTRETVEWDVIAKKYKIPPRAIAKHTRTTEYLRADILRPREK